MKNVKLEEILISEIEIIPAFNIREDFGVEESNDLEESLMRTDGNIQPIIVCRKDDKYDLICGERRLRASKKLNFEKILCIIFDDLTEIEKHQIMFNENLGRKPLTWQEEIKGLKRFQQLGYKIDVDFFENQKKISKQRVWSLLEGLQAIEEFPELLKEKTRKSCIIKYRKLKRQDEEFSFNRNINIKNSIDKIEKNNELDNCNAIPENIFDIVKKSDVVERLSNGIWLSNEVKLLIESARSCEDFGLFEEENEECKKCKKENPNVCKKCEFYNNEIN